jgi:diguanylate cyclase (GGDEF)-like protein
MGGISTRQEMRFSAAMWTIGAVTGLVGSFVPHGPGVNADGWLALSGAAAIIAIWSWRHDVEIPLKVQYVLSVLAAAAVGTALLCAHHSPAIFVAASLYVLPTIYTAAFYGSRPFGLYLVSQAIILGVLLFTSGQPAAPAAWVFETTTISALGVVVHRLRAALIEMATTDPLTGLANRRAFEAILERELSQRQRNGRPLCIAVIDLDHFKAINDEHGHVVGDQVLTDVATAWCGRLRKFDVLARYGGDEFVVMFPAASVTEATDILARMRTSAAHQFSAGVVEANGHPNPPELLRAADRACYLAKESGRGHIQIAGEL